MRMYLCHGFPAVLLALFFGFAQAAGTPPVIYDGQKDLLTVNVEEASLKDLMGNIAVQSGVEILIDPAVEKPVSARFSELPLDEGLKRICRGLSTVFIHDDAPAEGGAPILIGMKLLPEGQLDSDQLVPVLPAEGEAFLREKNRKPRRERAPLSETLNSINHIEQRWQARLDRMPPEKREKLQQYADQRLDRLERRDRKKEKQHAARQQRKAEKEARRQAELDDLKKHNPERYELRMQRRASGSDSDPAGE